MGVTESSKPVYVFLEGEFWGVYTMTEKQDEHYIEKHYGVDKDNVLIVKNGVPETENTAAFEKLFGELQTFLLERDLSEDSTYREFSEMVDLDSLMDYFAARIYADEGNDWPKSNTSIWRCIEKSNRPYEDGRWRFLNFDNNIEFQPQSIEVDTLSLILEQGEKDREELLKDFQRGELSKSDNYRYVRFMFCCLMRNESFRRDFLQRFEEICSTVYEPANSLNVLEVVASAMREPMVASYPRWFGSRCSYEDFDRKIDEIRQFLTQREAYILPRVRELCS